MNFISLFADVVKPIKLRGTGTFHPQETSIINENLSCIRQKDVNIWFYRKNDTIIAIDSGYHTEESFFQDLEKLNIENEAISAVFLTHGDVDHMGGFLSTPRFAPQAMIYLHKYEENMILGKENRFGKGPIRIKNPVHFPGEYSVLEDGDKVVTEGIEVEILLCSGHTKGHSYYLVDGKYLFSGDSIAINEEGGHCFFDFYNMNSKENIDSIGKIEKLLKKRPPLFICTSHSGIHPYERAFLCKNTISKASKKHPFDKNAPVDVFASNG